MGVFFRLRKISISKFIRVLSNINTEDCRFRNLCVCVCVYLHIKSSVQNHPLTFQMSGHIIEIRVAGIEIVHRIHRACPCPYTIAIATAIAVAPIHRMEMRNDGLCNFPSTIQCPYFNDNNGI